MVTMFFTVSVINNYALNFNIAMPLHMIFRSVRIDAFHPRCQMFLIITDLRGWPAFLCSLQGSLIANMILGIIILKKRYPASSNMTNSQLYLVFSVTVWLQFVVSHLLSLQIFSKQISVYSFNFSWYLHLHHHVCQTSGESPAEPVAVCAHCCWLSCNTTMCCCNIFVTLCDFVSAECGQRGIRRTRFLCLHALAYRWVWVQQIQTHRC